MAAGKSRTLFGVVVKNGGDTPRVIRPFALQTDQLRQPAGMAQFVGPATSGVGGEVVISNGTNRVQMR